MYFSKQEKYTIVGHSTREFAAISISKSCTTPVLDGLEIHKIHKHIRIYMYVILMYFMLFNLEVVEINEMKYLQIIFF